MEEDLVWLNVWSMLVFFCLFCTNIILFALGRYFNGCNAILFGVNSKLCDFRVLL